MSDRMLKNVKCSVNIFKLLFCNLFILFNKQYKTVKNTFWLFNLCNGEKNGKLGLHGGGK